MKYFMECYGVIKTWFVTGTDTEVGKTHSSCALLAALAQHAGGRVAGFKPLASGSVWRQGRLYNEDALALLAAGNMALSYEDVNVLSLEEATAPHIASVAEGRPIVLEALNQGLQRLQEQADYVVVEGAGGWHVPLLPGVDFADWVVGRQLPVILVVGVKLGCINHAVLTAQAIMAMGLRLEGWIANEITPPGPRQAEYLATLNTLLPAPCLGVLAHGVAASEAGQRLDLAPIMATGSQG